MPAQKRPAGSHLPSLKRVVPWARRLRRRAGGRHPPLSQSGDRALERHDQAAVVGERKRADALGKADRLQVHAPKHRPSAAVRARCRPTGDAGKPRPRPDPRPSRSAVLATIRSDMRAALQDADFDQAIGAPVDRQPVAQRMAERRHVELEHVAVLRRHTFREAQDRTAEQVHVQVARAAGTPGT